MITQEKHYPSKDLLQEGLKRFWANYHRIPNAPFYRTEFWCPQELFDKWQKEGLDPSQDRASIFHYDPPAIFMLNGLGWTSPAYCPAFEEKLVEDRGEHEVWQDTAGLMVLRFKGRTIGFMPEYLDHPVKDWQTWQENVKWRLNPDTPARWCGFDEHMRQAQNAASVGMLICQNVAGWQYLRAMFGIERLLMMFYDDPALIHDCMKTWLHLADVYTSKVQQFVEIDELYLSEDICYKTGSLVGPNIIKEFLFPYYKALIERIKSRQSAKKHLYVHIDTDGHLPSVIDLYIEHLGADVFSPCEVAAGCDVVELGKKYPHIIFHGGIDKRILATTHQQIDQYVSAILPVMRQRGGYYPTCDHMVPLEVTLDNYLFYRKRCIELGG